MGVCGFCLMTSGTDRLYLRGLVCVCVSEATLGNEVRVHENKGLFLLLLLTESLPANCRQPLNHTVCGKTSEACVLLHSGCETLAWS